MAQTHIHRGNLYIFLDLGNTGLNFNFYRFLEFVIILL